MNEILAPRHRIRSLACDLALLSALILATLCVYHAAWRGGMLWDDNAHVTAPELRSWEGLCRIWTELGATQQYYPLLHSMFWLEHRAWGDAAFGYHWANIFEHALSAFLVYKLCAALHLRGGLLAAFIFAVHPVAVESVAWISEQKNTLSGVFYLAAFLAYLRFDRKPSGFGYGAALLFFAAALSTKTVTATLPAVMGCVLWWRDGSLKWSRHILPLLPFLIVGVGAGAFSAHVEHSLIGAQGADFRLTLFEKLLLCGETFWFYLGKAVWPHPLVFIYPRWSEAQILSGWYYLAGALALAVALWSLRRRSRAPLAIFLIYAGTLFPALGLLNVYPFLFSYVADHFQYLALLALIIPFCAWFRYILQPSPVAIYTLTGAALVGGLGLLTAHQAALYTDSSTLYQSILARNPTCWMAHNNLGMFYAAKAATFEAAIAEYRAALVIKPDWPDTHYNLANVYALSPQHRAEAVDEYRRAIALQPDFAEAHNNLGKFLASEGGDDRAAANEFKTALQINPRLAAAHVNLGSLYSKHGDRLSDAVAEYREAVSLDPTIEAAYVNLGLVLSRMPGHQEEAISSYRKALQLHEDVAETHFNLAGLLAEKGAVGEAIAHYTRAEALEPDRVAIKYLLRDLEGRRARNGH